MTQEELETALADTTAQLNDAKQRNEALAAENGTIASQLKVSTTALLDGVPPAYRELVPTGPIETQLEWIAKATNAGLFKPVVPTTDTTKPTITPKDSDVSGLSPFARLAAAYK